jgi:transposase InsO family protein
MSLWHLNRPRSSRAKKKTAATAALDQEESMTAETEQEISEQEVTKGQVSEQDHKASGSAVSAPSKLHLEQLREIIDVEVATHQPKAGQGGKVQQPRRRLEDHVRQRAVDFYQRLTNAGGTLQQAAERLQICPRTLRQWDYDCRHPVVEPSSLGRPSSLMPDEQRQAILDWLGRQDSRIGLPRLRIEFPDWTRAALTDVLGDYREQWRLEHYRSVRVLHWQVPGRVWAIDFAEPSLLKATCSLPPVDGLYPYLLAVRDLASGYQLAWLPMAEANAARVQALLDKLFSEHGAPLVLKSDNGGPFCADETKAFVDGAGVYSLFSPPACPGYNGSIEAAIGSLKKRTQAEALAHQRPASWTSADVEAARAQMNTGHPERLNGRTPTEVWERGSVIGITERLRFAMAVEDERERARTELGMSLTATLDHWEQGQVDRKAIGRALVEHDYLLFTRRRIPLTIGAQKVTSGV